MTWSQWVLIGVLVLLIFAYPFIARARNKRENEKLIERTNSLKRGDKILTTSGVYGKILEVREEDGAKKVVIETGNDKYKSYMTIDAYAIYTVLNDEVKPQEKIEIKEEKKEEPKVEEKAIEVKTEEKKEEVEKPKGTKKVSTKKSSTKSKTTKK